ncbi:Uncharacterised protein [Shigella sonnei]|nr:Uncharacterised protein [Shigella sonnei]CSP89018.1 Uncharacterised protein [Shigella sonnei]CSQ08816.1 Uncharacterised protein [Shigella sonnei]
MVTFPINSTKADLFESQQPVSQCSDVVPVTVIRLQDINGCVVSLLLPEKETFERTP